MQDVYRGNAKLGDPNSLNSQLEDNSSKIKALEVELSKYEVSRCYCCKVKVMLIFM